MHKAIDTRIQKVAEYYTRTACSDAYLVTMGVLNVFLFCYFNSCLALNPEEKTAHFKRHWDASLQKDIMEHLEKIVSQC